jgi:hypothetical protein
VNWLSEVAQGRQLVTLKDAGNYITKLPKPEHTAPEWQPKKSIGTSTNGSFGSG